MQQGHHEAEEAGDRPSLEALLGLGSNLGDRAQMLSAALEMLASCEAVSLIDQSSVYETEPVGVIDQPPFLNMVARIRTRLSPERLLDVLQEIERDLGRTRTIRRGPRTIDLDILLIEGVQLDTSRLTVPHSELTRRQFVLVPLAEIAPEAELPGGATAGSLSAGKSDEVRALGPLDRLIEKAQEGSD